MTQETQAQNDVKILPRERMPAINALISSTQALIDLAERESKALAQNDLMNFHIMQDEKLYLADRYEKQSKEFNARIEEFRGIDRGVLERLENVQNTLGEKASSNNELVIAMRDRAQQKTQSSLLTVQELAQNKNVHLNAQDTAQDERK